MSQVVIQRVRLGPNGRLRLRPAKPSSYPYIYRDASSVRWDDGSGELYVLEVPGFDAVADFKQIIAAVAQEYGDELVLLPLTEYVNGAADMFATFARFAG